MIDLQLNLSTQEQYLDSLALIRQRITIGRANSDLPSALRLSVRLPYGQVELFMQSSNLYLIGFRGKDKVYALEDKLQGKLKSAVFSASIRDSGRLNSGEQVAPVGQRSDHGSLGTFSRAFDYTDLSNCHTLAIYREGDPPAMIRRPLALLVCVLCEGARFLQVQNAFAGVGYVPGRYWPRALRGEGLWGSSVMASEVVNYWSNATRARTVAERHGFGVTDGHKRAVELKTGLQKLETALSAHSAPFSRSMLYSWIASQGQPTLAKYESLPAIAPVLTELRASAKTAKLDTGTKVNDFIIALQSEIAVQASSGLLLPAIH